MYIYIYIFTFRINYTFLNFYDIFYLIRFWLSSGKIFIAHLLHCDGNGSYGTSENSSLSVLSYRKSLIK